MEEIFDVVVSYPDSMGAVFELESVLEITKMHAQLATSLRDSLTRRLNHPGANTSQVSVGYKLGNHSLELVQSNVEDCSLSSTFLWMLLSDY